MKNMNEESVERKGSMLEGLVETIFKSAGFEVKRNYFLNGFEIDVLVSFGDRTLIIECKQYEKSYLPVTNLILQWKAKNEIIRADGIILVIYGVDISQEAFDLALEYGIRIWRIEELNHFLGLLNDKTKLCAAILEALEIKERDIAETNAMILKRLIWRTLLSGSLTVSSEDKYRVFRKALRNRLITNLKQFGSTSEIRENHLSFFENVIKQEKIKMVFFFEIKSKISQETIWEDIKNKLKEIKPFDDEINQQYLGYMERLEQGFEEYFNWFLEDKAMINNKLVRERILNLSPDRCAEFIVNSSRVIDVYYNRIELDESAIKDIHYLEWVLTDMNHEIYYDTDEKGSESNKRLCWFTDTIEETVEYVCRILYEYYGIQPTDIIKDRTV